MGDLTIIVCKTETAPDRQPICLALKTLGSAEIYRFGGPGQEPIATGLEILRHADVIITHSKFHVDVFRRCGIVGNILDTAQFAQTIWGFSGLDAVGSRLKYKRAAFAGDVAWSQVAEDRCVRDVMLLIEPLFELAMARGLLN